MLRFGHQNGHDEKIRVGVIGATSFVAEAAVIPAIIKSPNTNLTAVASREKTDELVSKYKVQGFNSYADLIKSDSIDAVYIPLPNSLHLDAIKFALTNNKHVLCEKPMAMSAQEARDLSLLADRSGLILMEAYMTHYHPRNMDLLDIVSAKQSVKIRHIHASFTGTLTRSDDYRWDPAMGGGSLRDVGIYLLAPILSATKQLPKSVLGSAVWSARGVDQSFSGLLEFRDGVTASIFSSFSAGEGQVLEFILERGRIRVEKAFTPTTEDNSFEVSDHEGHSETFRSKPANSYFEMVNHFAELIRRHASPLRPLTETVLVQRVIDHLLISAQQNRIEYLDQS